MPLVFREPGGRRSLAAEIAELAEAPVAAGTEVAEPAEVARPAADAEQVAQLGTDLESGVDRAQLHVAIEALDAQRSARADGS